MIWQRKYKHHWIGHGLRHDGLLHEIKEGMDTVLQQIGIVSYHNKNKVVLLNGNV